MLVKLNKRSFFFTIGILLFLSSFSQKSQQNDSLLFKQNIAKAKEIKLDTFLLMWMNNYDIEPHRLGFSEFHRDSTFTYFKDAKYSFRILNAELNKIDYKAIDGSVLKEKLYDEILPMKDKIDIEVIKCEIGGRKGFDDFKCTFIESEQVLSFYFTYFVKCDFFYKFKKNYSAKYLLNTKELINTTPKSANQISK